MGAFAIVPFFVRNVILSGWLVYPFTAVDLFDVDFKIPKGIKKTYHKHNCHMEIAIHFSFSFPDPINYKYCQQENATESQHKKNLSSVCIRQELLGWSYTVRGQQTT